MQEAAFPRELTDDTPSPGNRQNSASLYGCIQDMGVAERIRLATLGNREARGLLIRDANRIVVQAVLNSPRLTEEEIIGFAANRNLAADVPRLISEKKEFIKSYPVKLALVNNSKTPVPIAVKLIDQLREHDLRTVAKNRNIASIVSRAALRALAQKDANRR